MTLASRLKSVRAIWGLTQAQMAARLGMPFRTYQANEMEDKALKYVLLSRLEDFDISADWLLTGRGPMLASARHGGGELPLFNPDLALDAWVAMIEGLKIAKVQLPPAKLAKLAVALYEMAAQEGDEHAEKLSPKMLAALLKTLV